MLHGLGCQECVESVMVRNRDRLTRLHASLASARHAISSDDYGKRVKSFPTCHAGARKTEEMSTLQQATVVREG